MKQSAKLAQSKTEDKVTSLAVLLATLLQVKLGRVFDNNNNNNKTTPSLSGDDDDDSET